MDAAPDAALRLDRQVCFPLYAASNLLIRRYRPLLDALGLTYPQYLVMLVLWEAAPLSVGEIGQRLYLDSGTLTPLLKRMERAGLITRQRTSADERRVSIDLSEAGRALHEQARTIPSTLLCEIGLTGDELAALRAQLQALTRRLAEQGK